MYIESDIVDVERQREIVARTNSLTKYVDFVEDHFSDTVSGIYFPRLNEYLSEIGKRQIPEDYFRLLTLVGILAWHYSYPYLQGQILHFERREEFGSVFSPVQQLSLAGFIARRIETFYPLKKEAFDYLESRRNNSSVGIWGIWPDQHSLEKRMDERSWREYMESITYLRCGNTRAICLPDRRLSIEMAKIDFDVVQMGMPSNVANVVLPKETGLVLEGYLNINNLTFCD